MAFLRPTLITFFMFLAVAVRADEDDAPSFSYEGNSPHEWHLLDDSFGKCKNGRRQSPINVAVNYTDVPSSHLPTIKPKLSVMKFEKDEYSLHLSCARQFTSCGSMHFHGKRYDLLQIHFHSWGEHHINGRAYPLELHFVHQSKEGQLAVYGVLFKVGRHNKALDAVLKRHAKNEYAVLDLHALAGGSEVDACIFQGSLTTPPCSEGVQWVVSLRIQEASMAQIGMYRQLVGDVRHNNRPLQPVNGRPLVCAARKPGGKLFPHDY